MTTLFHPKDSREELYQGYNALAARVNHLRSVIQNEGPYPLADVKAWQEDTTSVMGDFIALSTLTAEYLRTRLGATDEVGK